MQNRINNSTQCFAISANDLLSGSVVYRARSGWSQELHSALLFQSRSAAEKDLGVAEKDIANVVDPYLIQVELDKQGIVQALHLREKIRDQGLHYQQSNLAKPFAEHAIRRIAL